MAVASPRPLPPRPVSRYEEVCREQGILPKFWRPARDALQIEETELDLSNLGLGDAQLCALLQDSTLVPAARIRLWRLCDLRIQGAGGEALAAVLKECTEILDVRRNEIGRRGCEAISAAMAEHRLASLRWLDLSRNSLRSDAVASLAAALSNCPILLRLELNHNVIQDGAALGKLVREHAHLTRLSMHCNYLSGRGICSLFQGVLQNSRAGLRLADIDVAWNGAGDADALAGAEAIAAVLEESVILYHLDLSYNSFDAECCAAIGEGLRDNHHLYGLHMVGNAAVVDADGFLSPLNSGPMAHSPLPSTRSPGALARFGDPVNAANSTLGSLPRAGSKESLGSQSSPGSWRSGSSSRAFPAVWSDDALLRERDVLEQRTTCWACEGWHRVELEWPLVQGEPEPRAVWAFTSLDNFRTGLRLRRAADASKFSAARMVPPTGEEIRVVFQVDAALRTPPGMASVSLAPQGLQPVDIELRACPELPQLQPPEDQEIVSQEQKTTAKGIVEHHIVLRAAAVGVLGRDAVAMPPSSCGAAGQRSVLLDAGDGSGVPVQMPRVTETEFKIRTRQTLTRAKSFWSGFKKDTDKVLNDCMKTDWSRAKVTRLIKDPDERDGVEKLVRANYKRILSLYRYLSAVGVAGDTPLGISQIEAGEAFSEMGCIDADTKISDVDRFFIASKVLPIEMKKQDIVVRNDKALTRHQFIEIILRVAEQRHCQKGDAADMVDAVGRVLANMERMCEARVNEMEQFFAALHTEAVDDVYKRHASSLQAVYQRFSGSLTPPGQANFMALVEFQSLLEGVGAYDERFQSRWSACAFRMGMMTQADECYSSRFQEMSFVEFQHALGAVVFLKAGFAPSRMPALLDEFFTNKLLPVLPAGAARTQTVGSASPAPAPSAAASPQPSAASRANQAPSPPPAASKASPAPSGGRRANPAPSPPPGARSRQLRSPSPGPGGALRRSDSTI